MLARVGCAPYPVRFAISFCGGLSSPVVYAAYPTKLRFGLVLVLETWFESRSAPACAVLRLMAKGARRTRQIADRDSERAGKGQSRVRGGREIAENRAIPANSRCSRLAQGHEHIEPGTARAMAF